MQDTKKKNQKKLIIAIVSMVLVIALLLTVLLIPQCKKRKEPPTLESVKAEYIALITNAQKVNEVLWGKGLPTHERVYSDGFSFKDSYGEGDKKTEKNIQGLIVETSTYGTIVAYHAWMFFIPIGEEEGIYYDFEKKAQLSAKPEEDDYYRYAVRVEEERPGEAKNTYLAEHLKAEGDKTYYYYNLEEFDLNDLVIYTETDEPYYDYVEKNCGYLSIDDIRAEAAVVYSSAMMKAIDEGVLTGVMTENGYLRHPRYIDNESVSDSGVSEFWLMKDNRDAGYDLKMWIYDFNTMKMLPDSDRDCVKISVERYPEGKPEERMEKTLTFVLENGHWYLDAPSF